MVHPRLNRISQLGDKNLVRGNTNVPQLLKFSQKRQTRFTGIYRVKN